MSVWLVYPSVAGLDWDRQSLYLNLCGLVLLAVLSWLLMKRLGQPGPDQPAAAFGQMAGN